jgi:hypothetical protein
MEWWSNGKTINSACFKTIVFIEIVLSIGRRIWENGK